MGAVVDIADINFVVVVVVVVVVEGRVEIVVDLHFVVVVCCDVVVLFVGAVYQSFVENRLVFVVVDKDFVGVFYFVDVDVVDVDAGVVDAGVVDAGVVDVVVELKVYHLLECSLFLLNLRVHPLWL